MRGLALSGGGFRATLFHLGVVSYLYDVESAWRTASAKAGDDWEEVVEKSRNIPVVEGEPKTIPDALTGIEYITSVSGGSILAAHLVLNWEKYTDFKDPDNFEKAANELVEFTRKDIRGRIVRRMPYSILVYIASVLWRKSPIINSRMPDWMRRSTSDSLERGYETHLYHGATLRDLKRERRPKLFLLTTNLGSETSSAAFTPYGLSTSEMSYPHGTMSVARAVAASSAFPGMFPAVLYDPIDDARAELKLSDGGIFDNLGVRKFWDLLESGKEIKEVIVSDASVKFRAQFGMEFLEPITVPVKAADILFRRVYWFEEQDALQKNENPRRCEFRFLKLREKFDDEDSDDITLLQEHGECLHSTRTDLDKFSDLEIAALVRHGYCVARKVLRYRLPDDASIRPRWNPLVQSKDTIAVYKRDAGATNRELVKATKRLKASEIRRKRLFSPSDWVSFLTIVLIAAPLVYLGWLIFRPFELDQVQVDTISKQENAISLQSEAIVVQEQTIGQQREKIDALGKLVSTIVPSDLKGKWGVPLETINVSSQGAIPDAVDFVGAASASGFKNVFIFKVWTKFSDTRGTYAFRPVAVYDTRSEAAAGKERAVLEINKTVTDILSFVEFCPNARWDASSGYYDCDNTIVELERRGFVMILEKNMPAAIDDFTRARELSPTHHNVDEISRLLISKQGPLAAATESEKAAIWSEIQKTIVRDFSWGMPADIKSAFEGDSLTKAG